MSDIIDRLHDLGDDVKRGEVISEIVFLRHQLRGAREVIEDAVETLESMDMHVDNPLYERMRAALEGTSAERP